MPCGRSVAGIESTHCRQASSAGHERQTSIAWRRAATEPRSAVRSNTARISGARHAAPGNRGTELVIEATSSARISSTGLRGYARVAVIPRAYDHVRCHAALSRRIAAPIS
jgi:hypothetical protein